MGFVFAQILAVYGAMPDLRKTPNGQNTETRAFQLEGSSAYAPVGKWKSSEVLIQCPKTRVRLICLETALEPNHC